VHELRSLRAALTESWSHRIQLRTRDRWLDRSWALAHAFASGRVYPNFPDPGLDDWATAYYGGNAERLRTVKRSYDPERLFRFPQAIW